MQVMSAFGRRMMGSFLSVHSSTAMSPPPPPKKMYLTPTVYLIAEVQQFVRHIFHVVNMQPKNKNLNINSSIVPNLTLNEPNILF
jgi:hypothetical protein